MNEKKGARTQNVGELDVGKMVKELAKTLGKDPIHFVANLMRSLAASQLTEAGMPVAGLQMEGN